MRKLQPSSKRQNTRDFLLLYINGERCEVRGADSFLMLSEFLRERRRLTGTKVVCAEGDCGACTVLRASPHPARKVLRFEAINSCIFPLFLADCSHLITVEGLRENGRLNELQSKLCDFNGAQCGFCTPGIVMALTEMFEQKSKVDFKTAQNFLTGNLCRCTGYLPILQAACAVDNTQLTRMHERYGDKAISRDLARHARIAIQLQHNDRFLRAPLTVSEAASWKCKHFRIFSAGTDLGVQSNKGHLNPAHGLSLNLIPELYGLKKVGKRIVVGAKVTLIELERFVADHVPEFESFLRVFASKQIKNVATLAGNVINGSPIGDTLPFLQVAGATVDVRGRKRSRQIPFTKFYRGYRKPDLKADEIVTSIAFDIPSPDEKLRLFKVAQRKDLDISCVNAGFRMQLQNGEVRDVRLALGGVGPTVMSLPRTEAFLRGKALNAETVNRSVEIMAAEIHPRSDVRGSDDYRVALSQNLLRKFVAEISR